MDMVVEKPKFLSLWPNPKKNDGVYNMSSPGRQFPIAEDLTARAQHHPASN